MTATNGAMILAVANQKGGVGKTTTAVNLAAGLTLAGYRVLLVDNLPVSGYRVLLVDFDPQGNATSGFGLSKRETKNNIFALLDGDITPADAVRKTKYGDIIPSSLDLAGCEIMLVNREAREFCLKNALAPLKAEYDVIVIDCPPGLGLLMINALTAADGVMIPLQCEYFALEGLTMMVDTIRSVRKRLNPTLEINGFLFTMFDGRTNLAAQVVREVKKYFADKIYKTVIVRNVRLSEAPSHGKPVQFYDKHSKGAKCYNELTEEFVNRVRLMKR